MISSSQRPLSDNTQHTQQTDFHAPDGIRTHNLRRRANVDLRLRRRGHWDRHIRVTFSRCTFMCCVLFSQLSSIFSLNRTNRFFFVRDTLCVFSEVKTGILSIIYVNSYSEGRAGVIFRTWCGRWIEATLSSGLSSCSFRSDIITFGQYSGYVSVFKSPTCYPKRESSPVN